MGGKPGNVLVVQAIPGLTYNTQVLNAGMRVLTACKDTIAGASFQATSIPATAKTQVLQLPAMHAATVDGAFQVSGDGSGHHGSPQSGWPHCAADW